MYGKGLAWALKAVDSECERVRARNRRPNTSGCRSVEKSGCEVLGFEARDEKLGMR